jgi:2-C-methyl-D-erythritol 4-phosphate cytidylyltransferase
MSRREAVVVVAAGTGDRLGPGGSGPKALVRVAGRTLLDLALDGLRQAAVQEVVVVHTPGYEQPFADIGRRHGVLLLVPGGATRSDSVRAGLQAVPSDVAVVAVHDAARPLTPPEVVRAVLDTVSGDVVAAAPARPVVDTLKRTDGERILDTVDRSGLVGVQTPQAFVPEVLRAALAGGGEASDDLAFVERAIADGVVTGRVQLVAGSPVGFKVTYPEDLDLLDALVAAHGPEAAR